MQIGRSMFLPCFCGRTCHHFLTYPQTRGSLARSQLSAVRVQCLLQHWIPLASSKVYGSCSFLIQGGPCSSVRSVREGGAKARLDARTLSKPGNHQSLLFQLACPCRSPTRTSRERQRLCCRGPMPTLKVHSPCMLVSSGRAWASFTFRKCEQLAGKEMLSYWTK